MTHITCRLTAKNRDQLRNTTLGNRVWATFTFFTTIVVFGADVRRGANAGARTAAPRLRRAAPSVRPSVRLSLYIDCFCRLTTSPGRRYIAYLVMVATSQPPRQLYRDHVAVGPLSCIVRDVVSWKTFHHGHQTHTWARLTYLPIQILVL